MRRDWKPLHESLNIFFNVLFVEQRDKIRNYTLTIAKQKRMIDRINDSKNSYVNDETIIKEKLNNIKTLTEQRSKLKSKQERLLKYSMDSVSMNNLILTLNKEIINEVLLGKYYNIPYWMGKIRFKYVRFNKRSLTINWVKSIENHLAITKRDAPIIYDKYVVQKTISKKEYFKLSKPFVAPSNPKKLWISYNQGGDFLFLSWFPNYGFINKFKNNYRFKFTTYNQLKDSRKTSDTKTETVLEYLDTPEKIISSRHLGNINKSILLQLQNPNYKYKVESDDI